MGRNLWIAGLALCVGVTGWAPAAAQVSERLTVPVLLQNDAGVPADLVDRAKQETTRVFAPANIGIEWVGGESYRPDRTFVLRLAPRPIGAKSRNRLVVGVAPGTREARGTIAFVFYDRIQTLSEELSLDDTQLLGHVMAHELGHLLLPYGAHSVTGVMREKWDRAQVHRARAGQLTFTTQQTALIRERLSAFASPSARAR